MKFSYVRCLLVMSTVLASCRGDDDSLEDAVRTLRGQVSALLERRQEDYKLLEESLKNELEKNSQLSSLRDEVETLRREVSLLRGNQQKNDHLTLQWLSSSVTELRAELTELAVAQNTSAELQRRQETESELHLLRGDSAALRRETEELRADVQKGAARAEQAAGDAEAARERSQAAQLTCADLSQQHMGDQKVISVRRSGNTFEELAAGWADSEAVASSMKQETVVPLIARVGNPPLK
uniref:Uncharacterized protein n=1 Tax=Timema monikensis TaxID=170555 RepID=A0A7R9HUP6_9NEOP|nr:unnamed protein product [Timema monikensis]